MAELIAYFSRADENYVGGTLKNLETGNTEVVAKLLAVHTGAPLFKLEPLVPYAADYNTCIAQAQDDQRRGARPELKAYPDSLDGYDVIYLGYPNYWGTMPMAVFTFLDRFDFAGKHIRPFCTHEGSGMGRSGQDIGRLCPHAIVEKGLAIQGGKAAQSETAIAAWTGK